MVKASSGGNADITDDKSKGADSGDDKGKAGDGKTGAADEGQGNADDKVFTQADLDAALARDRQERKRVAASKSTATTNKKDKPEESEEAEQFRKRAEAAEASLRARDARDTVEKAAKDAGFSNPSKIYRLLRDDLSFDDAGKPDNVKDLITIARRDFPEEIAAKTAGSADAGAGKGSSGAAKSSMNDFIRKATGRG